MSAERARVAIVEDDELVARALRAMIEGAGCTASAIVGTYEEATALLEGGERYDIAFVDLRLGGKETGADIAQRAVQLGIAVVVMTGSAVLPDGLSGAALLMKPFSVDQVQTLLHQLRVLPAQCAITDKA